MVARLPQGWDVEAIAQLDDPYPVWAELREADPVHELGGNLFVVTRRDLAEQVLRDPRLRAGGDLAGPPGDAEGLLADVRAAWLTALDGEAHADARNLVIREFTPRRVGASNARIEARARALVEAFVASAEREPTDWIGAVAFALPSEVMRELFRIDPEEWRERVESLLRPAAAGGRSRGAAIAALAEYFDELLRTPDEIDPKSLLALLAEPDPEAGELTDIEVVANSVLLVAAGIDTTEALIGNTVLCLLRNPEQLARVRAERLVAEAVEEALRFEPPVVACTRWAEAAFTLGGHAILEGAQLLVSIAAANRDPRQHADPDRFDVLRSEAEPLSFGAGRHVCPGAALARLEARAALEALLDASESLSLEAFAWRRDDPMLRGLAELRLSARARRG